MATRGIAGARSTHSAIGRIACGLAAIVCAFTAENIWIDPWLARKSHHRLPSFLPEPLGGWWFLVLLSLGLAVVLLLVCQVLLMKDGATPVWKRTLSGIFVIGTIVLAGEWFVATGGMKLVQRSVPAPPRSVVLRWKASTTPGVKYNVYRGPFFGVHPEKLNSAPIDGLTFTDANVESGATYYYVVRAINAAGEESVESNELGVTIP
jgi:hypothetical protein